MESKLADLPMKLLMPSSFDNMREIAFKTIPSASKVEIKRVLQTMYGIEVEKVRTLNMQGKKKQGGGRLVARPNYKKAYVTLKNPLSIAHDLYPAHAIEKDKSADRQLNDVLTMRCPGLRGSSEFYSVGTLGPYKKNKSLES